jgi:Ubiquitin fold domain
VLGTHTFGVALQSQERLPLRFSQLIESVSKKPILPHQKNVIVEVMVSDENDEDVEVSLTLRLRSVVF